MQYTVVTSGSRHFEVLDDRQRHLGSLDYAGWGANKAQIIVDNDMVYNVSMGGFWNGSKKITKNGIDYAMVKPDLGRGLVLSFENGRNLRFRRRGMWSNSYVMTNEEDQVMGTVWAEFQWSRLNFKYTVEVDGLLWDRDTERVLPFLMIYCLRYMRMRSSAAV